MSTTILRRRSVQAVTGLSRSGLYKKQAEGEFPQSISLGPRAVGWLEHEVQAWVASRIAASRGDGR